MELTKLSKEAMEDGIKEGESWLKQLEDDANEYEITDFCAETDDNSKVEDAEVNKLLESTQKTETTRITSVNRLKTAFNLADMKATIEKGGAHDDGSPKLALAKVGEKKVSCTVEDSGKLQMDRVKDIAWPFPCPASAESKRVDKITLLFSSLGFTAGITLLVLGIMFVEGSFLLPLGFLDFLTYAVTAVLIATGGIMTGCCIAKLCDTYNNFFTCDTPIIPKIVLEKLKGEGPFYTLFEVEKGWERVAPDPVIFRLIIVNGKDYWEPQAGWDMTKREKGSMTSLE